MDRRHPGGRVDPRHAATARPAAGRARGGARGPPGQAGIGLPDDADADADERDPISWQEARRLERQRDEAAAARGANAELGRQTAERFHKLKITTELARLVALLVLEDDGDSWAARGLRYAERRRRGDYVMGRLERALTR